MQSSPKGLKFFFAARPKTWSTAIAPVLIGMSLSLKEGTYSYPLFIQLLLFALLIQIGTNFANDYFDFIKGADTHERVGPKRAVQQGWISPNVMRQSFILTFGAAFLIGLPLMLKVGLFGLLIGISSVLFGIWYTGGKKPLGYLGFGEVLVFIFYGPVACLGTYFIQTGHITPTSVLASIPPGLLSSAIILSNNLRDQVTDEKASKKTLVVRFGVPFGKNLYLFLLITACVISFFFSSLLPLSFVFAIPPILHLRRSEFFPLLPKTSFLLLVYSISFFFASL